MRDSILMQDIYEYLAVDLEMFNNTMLTTTGSLSGEMKTHYDNTLIDNAWAELVHDQFAQKRPIPKNKGKIIEFRNYATLGKQTTPLTEGTTPSGQTLTMSVVTATIAQYGGYVEMSDILDMTAIDNNIVETTMLLGHQAGETLDTITRDIINGGTSVQYANAEVAARYLLVGGSATPSANHYFSVNAVRRAVRSLKVNKTKKIGGYYVAIIHPDVSYDLMGDDDWVSVSEYGKPGQIFEGEIGKIHGTRFVETTEAKIFHAADLVTITNATRNLTCASVNTKTFTMAEALSAAEVVALVARKVIIKGYKYTIASGVAGTAGTATLTVTETVSGTPTTDVCYPGEAGAAGRDIYSTLILGADAYGTVDIEGGGIETIVKQLGSSGTADPLNQRATVGWKAIKTAIRLTEGFMTRVETASTFNDLAAN